MGRKPLPTEMKRAAGNPGKRPLPADEPKPKSSRLKIPDRIKGNKVAEKEYRSLGKALVESGVMTTLDERALGEAAVLYSDLMEQDTLLRNEGAVLTGRAGGSYINPRRNLVTGLQDRYFSMLAEFGMTPSGRTKVRTANAVATGGKGTAEAMLPGIEAGQIARAAEAWVPPTVKPPG